MTSSDRPLIVITGGGGGIGRATALLCAKRGDRVAILKKFVTEEIRDQTEMTLSPEDGLSLVPHFRSVSPVWPQIPWPQIPATNSTKCQSRLATNSWPQIPTMEGAVRSGYMAAEAISHAVGKPARFIEPDLAPTGLMRLLP